MQCINVHKPEELAARSLIFQSRRQIFNFSASSITEVATFQTHLSSFNSAVQEHLIIFAKVQSFLHRHRSFNRLFYIFDSSRAAVATLLSFFLSRTPKIWHRRCRLAIIISLELLPSCHHNCNRLGVAVLPS